MLDRDLGRIYSKFAIQSHSLLLHEIKVNSQQFSAILNNTQLFSDYQQFSALLKNAQQ